MRLGVVMMEVLTACTPEAEAGGPTTLVAQLWRNCNCGILCARSTRMSTFESSCLVCLAGACNGTTSQSVLLNRWILLCNVQLLRPRPRTRKSVHEIVNALEQLVARSKATVQTTGEKSILIPKSRTKLYIDIWGSDRTFAMS